MKRKLIAGLLAVAIILSALGSAIASIIVNAESITVNDLHPEDGAPAMLKKDATLYRDEKCAEATDDKIPAGTVIRVLDDNAVLYHGNKRYVKQGVLLTGDELDAYAVSHVNEFDKKVTATEKTHLYDIDTYKEYAIVAKDTAFLIEDEDDDFYVVLLDNQKALLPKKFGKDEIYVKVTSFNNDTESIKSIKDSLLKLAEQLGIQISLNDFDSEIGSAIVNYARQFVGNPYVWGGNSLTDGCDCSGFTQQVLAHFEISIPRHSGDQAKVGITVDKEDLQPGDLLFFNRGNRIGHVAIYAGNGMIVHAKGSDYGIVLEKLKETPVICKRYIENSEVCNIEE